MPLDQFAEPLPPRLPVTGFLSVVGAVADRLDRPAQPARVAARRMKEMKRENVFMSTIWD